jgi:hypothetical protein
VAKWQGFSEKWSSGLTSDNGTSGTTTLQDAIARWFNAVSGNAGNFEVGGRPFRCNKQWFVLRDTECCSQDKIAQSICYLGANQKVFLMLLWSPTIYDLRYKLPKYICLQCRGLPTGPCTLQGLDSLHPRCVHCSFNRAHILEIIDASMWMFSCSLMTKTMLCFLGCLCPRLPPRPWAASLSIMF